MLGEIRNRQGEVIDYSFHPGKSGSKDIVVIGHGVTGNKDRPFLVALADGLAQSGINALRISFSGNGNSGGSFEHSTISKEVEDLGSVFDALKDYRIAYAGHSMGGAVGVLRASKDRRTSLLISLAGMVHTKAFAQREFGDVKPGNGLMWDNPECPLSQAYVDDMARIDTVANAGSEIKIPWLLVHGTSDDVVPIQDSYDIYGKASQPKQLIELQGSGHLFEREFTKAMVEKVVDWIKALWK